MTKKILLLLGVGVMMTMNSCTDLEETLVGDITQNITAPGVPGGGTVSTPLAGAYGSLRDAGTANHGSYYSLQEITSDEMCIAAKGGDWFDGGILVQLHQHTYGPTHDFVNNAWTGTYAAINQVNELIAGGLDGDESLLAQARALRAYFYLRLCDMYGNVKIITEPGADAPQSSRQEVFNFIESELLAALNVAEISSSMDLSASALGTEFSPYIINQYGALGLIAKLYLNAEVYTGTARWAEAAAASDYIISSGVYRLSDETVSVANLGKRPAVASDPENLTGYAAVFAPNNENNPEHIFVVQYDEASAGGMNFSQMNLHYSSQFSYNLQSQPWNGYASLEEFYNSYEDGDARKTNNFLAGEQLDFSGNPILDYAADDDNIILNYNPSINELQPNSLREAGVRPAKFSYKQLGRDNMDNDYPIVRLGDVYLMRGEAMARMAGDWNVALDDVNTIRARAGVAAMNSIDADGFLAERGREMFQESARRTDLIRFGAYNDAWWEKAPSAEFYNIFPIPFNQIQAASQDGIEPLVQNPGY